MTSNDQTHDAAAAMPDELEDSPEFREFQELGRLYEKFCGPVSEAVLKARWQMIEPNDLLSWDMRRASSTGLAADEMFCGEFCRDACGVYDLEDEADGDE